MGTRRSKPKTDETLALREIREIRELIDTNIVWSRSLDKPYQVWQRLAYLLDGVLSGNEEEAIEDTLRYFDAAMELPKAHRDKEFRTLLRLLRVTALTCQKM